MLGKYNATLDVSTKTIDDFHLLNRYKIFVSLFYKYQKTEKNTFKKIILKCFSQNLKHLKFLWLCSLIIDSD